MDWFLYDNDLRHERVKQKILLFEKRFSGNLQRKFAFEKLEAI